MKFIIKYLLLTFSLYIIGSAIIVILKLHPLLIMALAVLLSVIPFCLEGKFVLEEIDGK